jgi:hypothetical protein
MIDDDDPLFSQLLPLLLVVVVVLGDTESRYNYKVMYQQYKYMQELWDTKALRDDKKRSTYYNQCIQGGYIRKLIFYQTAVLNQKATRREPHNSSLPQSK